MIRKLFNDDVSRLINVEKDINKNADSDMDAPHLIFAAASNAMVLNFYNY